MEEIKSNYQKAKEEGINEIEKLAERFYESEYVGSKPQFLISIEKGKALFSSFAEKIKEGRDKDLRRYLQHGFICGIRRSQKQCDCGLDKLLSSDSQTIKE